MDNVSNEGKSSRTRKLALETIQLPDGLAEPILEDVEAQTV
ncbi:hypothetical protein SOVF_048230 [Spinacia oleracea]|nr:hypothetical protein SOVF_048230 [Spinacia oleracea]